MVRDMLTDIIQFIHKPRPPSSRPAQIHPRLFTCKFMTPHGPVCHSDDRGIMSPVFKGAARLYLFQQIWRTIRLAPRPTDQVMRPCQCVHTIELDKAQMINNVLGFDPGCRTQKHVMVEKHATGGLIIDTRGRHSSITQETRAVSPPYALPTPLASPISSRSWPKKTTTQITK